MKSLVLFITLVFAMEKNTENAEQISGQISAYTPILVKIEEDEYGKVNKFSSNYFGVTYNKISSMWRAQRCSKNENNKAYNGHYKDEKTAALASDTLARKLMADGEQNHKLNFPDDDTKVYPEEKKTSSKFIGVSYNKSKKTWHAQRKSKNEGKTVNNGNYKDEETAAHASDTLARKLMKNGEHHKLNFPDDDTEVNPREKEPSSKFIGVSYNVKKARWIAQRRSKDETISRYNGIYKNEEAAARASDTLARKLMINGKHPYKLNFPDDDTKVHPEEHLNSKRKRPNDFSVSQTDGNFEKLE